MLSLAEELMLLALRDDKGSVLFSASTALPYGLSGAVLLDLLFQEKITIKENKVKSTTSKLPDEEILKETLTLIRNSTKERKLQYWVQHIHSKIKKLDKRVTNGLVEKGILKHEEAKVLWVFSVDRYPTLDAVPELEIRRKIKNVVLNRHEPAEREIALISLVKACELVNEVFEKGERKQAKKRIKEIIEDEAVGKAVSQVVQEITTAVMTVIIASTAATTAASS